MPRAAMQLTAAMAATDMMQNVPMIHLSSVALAVPEAMAAAVLVQASVHAAPMAAAAVPAVSAMVLMDRKQHNMAWMVMLVMPVAPLAAWARSMWLRLSSI